jgi:type IV pilus assembly protein PilY1
MHTSRHKYSLIPKHLLPVRIACLLAIFSTSTSHAALSQSPLYLTIPTDPNLLINLSVEGPMGGAAYSDQQDNPPGCTGRKNDVLGDINADNIGSCYFQDSEYLGYFDSTKCYDYHSGQFNPGDAASNHTCSDSTNGRWSGNFLNWACMTAIDEFIFSMTGGNRVIDTPAATVVRRAFSHPSWFPLKVVNSTLNVAPSTVTPYTDTTLYIENAPPTSTSSSRMGAFKMQIGTSYAKATGMTPDKGSFEIKVKLCETSTNKEANCTAYTNNGTYYKPEGLLQKNASAKRYALTSYTADNAPSRQGGVLRTKMKYIAPFKPNGSGGIMANSAQEFDENGLIIHNPDGATGGLNSGIINYINKFSDTGYKSLDPVSELFYESLRYYKNLGPTPENYAGIIRNSSDKNTGGFWFYQDGEWDDPILYACQKNTILAINDAYPWLDKHLPGSAFTSSTLAATGNNGSYDLDDPMTKDSTKGDYQPTNDWGEPANSTAEIDVKALTDEVGNMENGRSYQHKSGLGYTFDLGHFRVGGSNNTLNKSPLTNAGTQGGYANCSKKNISAVGQGLGSVMSTCPAVAFGTDNLDTLAASRDNTYYIAGLAWYANTLDIRPDLKNTQTVSSFLIDTQEYHSTPNVGPSNPLWLAAKYGGFSDSGDESQPQDGNPNLDKTGAENNSEWDGDNDGEPDHYLLASDPLKLVSALNKVFSTLDKQVSSASSVAANSTQLNPGTQVFQAKFASDDWSGQLQASNVDAKGVLTPAWDVWFPEPASRNIYTYNPLAALGSRGITFQWDNLSKETDNPAPMPFSQQTYLNTLNMAVDTSKGTLRLDWLRGITTGEKHDNADTTHLFRHRSQILGDIINDDPVFVSTQDYGYGALPGLGNSYGSFRTTHKDRRPMLYVGANDGMLHGFDANSVAGGKEIFAYIPNAVFPKLSQLTDPSYSHQYYVDGASGVGDVYDGKAWHTVLTGTTGAGGRALFALDVTTPDSFGSSHVLWEFTDTHDTDLGYTLAQPSVVRMQEGSWAVIVGNGYDSDNGHAVLFVLDALTGKVLQKIDTGIGTTTRKNGLSSPVAVDSNHDLGVDTVYAGDLYGHLWKFDVSASAGNWPVPTRPLFVACTTSGTSCSAANRQPITGKPNIGKTGTDQNNKGLMVYFGTGKYIDTGDNIVGSNPQIQTFYGLWDQGLTIPDRKSLQEQTINYTGYANAVCASGNSSCATAKPIRVVSKNTVCHSATNLGCTASSPLKNGWALNLSANPGNIAKGERVISHPLIRRNLVIFSTVTPNPDPCLMEGTSFLMELDALTGSAFGAAAFDVNGDGKVNGNDKIMLTTNGIEYFASGIDAGIGIIKTPTVIEAGATHVGFKYASGSTSNMAAVIGLGGGGATLGTRRSWRQLK